MAQPRLNKPFATKHLQGWSGASGASSGAKWRFRHSVTPSAATCYRIEWRKWRKFYSITILRSQGVYIYGHK